MKYINLDQSGPDWHRWRAEGLGGSDACVVMETVSWTTPDELTRQKQEGIVTPENDRMARGKRLEPVARNLYQELTGIRVRPVCVVHDEYEWMRASLDGLSEDGRLVLEIKCPSDRAHKKALEGHYPDYYRPQLQHQMAVTGCELLHYFSYTDSKTFGPGDHFALVPVKPDPEYIRRLILREKRYYQSLKKTA